MLPPPVLSSPVLVLPPVMVVLPVPPIVVRVWAQTAV